ncbi:hypothetical protein GA0115251_130247 [Streptomyces sp. TverLS-915]|nr:hypothetical protein GA0115251_130247 [Streptomyces sp. TverLS-915]
MGRSRERRDRRTVRLSGNRLPQPIPPRVRPHSSPKGPPEAVRRRVPGSMPEFCPLWQWPVARATFTSGPLGRNGGRGTGWEGRGRGGVRVMRVRAPACGSDRARGRTLNGRTTRSLVPPAHTPTHRPAPPLHRPAPHSSAPPPAPPPRPLTARPRTAAPASHAVSAPYRRPFPARQPASPPGSAARDSSVPYRPHRTGPHPHFRAHARTGAGAGAPDHRHPPRRSPHPPHRSPRTPHRSHRPPRRARRLPHRSPRHLPHPRSPGSHHALGGVRRRPVYGGPARLRAARGWGRGGGARARGGVRGLSCDAASG